MARASEEDVRGWLSLRPQPEADLEILIGAAGEIEFIYNDDLAEALEGLGEEKRERASHVEPAPGGWTADTAPCGGPILGPYRRRDEALAAERAWLHDEMGKRSLNL